VKCQPPQFRDASETGATRQHRPAGCAFARRKHLPLVLQWDTSNANISLMSA
jgi:hypothetical protein